MLIRYFDIPSRLKLYIERALMIDFSLSVGSTWQFLPTGGFGVTLLTGPAEHDYELERPDDDGAFSGIAGHVMGTWCERPCLAFGITLTPIGVMHLPLHDHDFDQSFALPSQAMFGAKRWRALRAQVRDARTPDDKMRAFLNWMETVLMGHFISHGRVGAIADAAAVMRHGRQPTIVEAARRTGVHRRQFERDFRHYLGTTPKRYMTVSRVQQFAQLSWEGMGLAGIAAELGFTDQAHMSHVVKEVAGMPPAALLRRLQTSELARATRPHTHGLITHF